MYIELHARIAADSDILSDKPVIVGTTIPVADIINRFITGQRIEEVVRESSISVDDVRAALEDAAERAGEETAVSDPLDQLSGIIASGNPGWADHHDDYFGSDDPYADEQ